VRFDRHWLVAGGGGAVALGVGFGTARLTDGPTEADPHGDAGGHEEEAGREGVVALSPEAAAGAGVTVATVALAGTFQWKWAILAWLRCHFLVALKIPL